MSVVHDAGTWTRQERLSPEASGAYDEFGIALAAYDSLAVIGTPSDIPVGMTEETITCTVTLFRGVR